MTISALAATAGVLLFPAAVVYAGLMDLVTLKIRNVLVLGLGGGVARLGAARRLQLAELGSSVAVAGGVFALTFVFFSLGWIGGGDAKLAAVTALWFEPAPGASLFYLCGVPRRVPDARHPAVAGEHAAGVALSRAVARSSARRQSGRALRRCDGSGRADRVSRHRLADARRLLSRRRVTSACADHNGHSISQAFRSASETAALTIL